MEHGKHVAVEMLSSIGLTITPIPEADSKRADLHGLDPRGGNYIIEAKDKDDVKLSPKQIERLKEGEAVSDAQRTNQNNTISGIFDDAAAQLEATPCSEPTFRLIWLFADGHDYQLICDRAFATFYGHVYLFDMASSDTEQNDLTRCFYFDYNSAYRLTSVDGLILCDRTGMQLLANEFSKSFSDFKASYLYSKFADQSACTDPTMSEASGESISFRSSIPRGDDKRTISEIEKQTGTRYTPIRFTRYSSSILTPPPKLDASDDAV